MLMLFTLGARSWLAGTPGECSQRQVRLRLISQIGIKSRWSHCAILVWAVELQHYLTGTPSGPGIVVSLQNLPGSAFRSKVLLGQALSHLNVINALTDSMPSAISASKGNTDCWQCTSVDAWKLTGGRLNEAHVQIHDMWSFPPLQQQTL